jgi:serine/threonine protein phosphatase PrpC
MHKYNEEVSSMNAVNAKSVVKPEDDGCTMVVNIQYQNHLININLGDSRTVLAKRKSHWITPDQRSRNSNQWELIFASTDHSLGDPKRAAQIHANGGQFITNNNRYFDAAFTEEDPKLHKRDYEALSQCRVQRPKSFIDPDGFARNTKALNLAATMGDFTFKSNPPLLSAIPDVTFTALERSAEYFLTIASDGLWDHLNGKMSPKWEAEHVIKFFNAEIDSIEIDMNLRKTRPQHFTEYAPQYHQLMKRLSNRLCDRQHNGYLFATNGNKFDDVTAIAAMIVTSGD